MADGFTIRASGIPEARRAIRERIQRANDLRPALKPVAEEIVKRTDDAFRNSESQFGEKWPQLALSTVLGRKGVRKAERRLNRRNESGKLTKSAINARAKLHGKGALQIFRTSSEAYATVKVTPLVDTARMRKSQRAWVAGKGTLRWSAVGYTGPHITGGERAGKSGRPPMRNPSPFKWDGNDFVMAPWLRTYLAKAVSSYIATGKVVTS